MRSSTGHPFILLLPVVVAELLWAAGWRDRRRGNSGPDFFERNGAAVGAYLIIAVGLWAVFMIEMSFRRKLSPIQTGGPNDIYTLENYRYFLFGSTTSTASWNTTHLHAFWLSIFVTDAALVRRADAGC